MRSVAIGSTLIAVTLLTATAAPASAHNLSRPHPGARWATSVERAIDVNLDYPAAVRLRQARSADVVFRVAPDGRLSQPVITRSTGVPALDEAAADAVLRTISVSAPPSTFAGQPITYRATFGASARQPGR